MCTLEEFKKLLIGGSMLFLILFILFWGYFYYTGRQAVAKTPEAEQAEDAFLQEQSVQMPLHQGTVLEAVPTVANDTKITLQMLDADGEVIAEEAIRNETLLGMTQTMVEQVFSEYTLTSFDAKEVCLQKQLQPFTTTATYTLVMRDKTLGILEAGAEGGFIPLQLPASTFTAKECALFEGSGLPITAKQKLQLQQQPYYIEQILQNYSE